MLSQLEPNTQMRWVVLSPPDLFGPTQSVGSPSTEVPTNSYQFIERAPTVEEYFTFCYGMGRSAYADPKQIAISLKNSLYHTLALYAGQPVGMGRIVGDGALCFYLHDLAVLPQHRRQGIGRDILNYLMAYLHVTAPPEAFIGLFASSSQYAFYRSCGFQLSDRNMYQYTSR